MNSSVLTLENEKRYTKILYLLLNDVCKLNNDDLLDDAAASIVDRFILLIDDDVSPSDVKNVIRVLEHRKTSLDLGVQETMFAGSYYRVFRNLIEKNRNIKLLELSIFNSKRSQDLHHLTSPNQCLDNLEVFQLVDCDVSNNLVKEIVGNLKGRNTRLRLLNLAWNHNIDDNGAKMLLECLDKIRVLNLESCSISPAMQIELIIRGRQTNCSVKVRATRKD